MRSSAASAVAHGLCAFTLTPTTPADEIDERAIQTLVARAAAAGVDSLGVLGSTGSYPYLTRDQRLRVATTAVEHAQGLPVLVGVGAIATRMVLDHVEDAQQAGAAGVLLPVMQYQPLTETEAYGLFEQVDANLSVPLVVYDNPATTRFSFSDDLYARVAELPNVAAIKVPPLPRDRAAARRRVEHLRGLLPAGVAIGVSGDAAACAGLLGGADAWYSVIGGTLPERAVALARAAIGGDYREAMRRDAELAPLWGFFAENGGSLRVVAAIAEELGLVRSSSLPAPLRGLDEPARIKLRALLGLV
ncbi:dihydrodipicolinate synthetase [Isoptericola variabilis 225]|uniref:Dihydrodipicolinate synthetase n=2 Tax=Isoptericola TaxID=254250 RepID=F6FR49_ISOV2|nr:dihydrodipicolinate synthetase [Isoptericola variabilis 225]